MSFQKIPQILFTTLICLVWFVNGLYCKLLNFVPRHRLIVSEILGNEYATLLTNAIGLSEVLMVVWILSRIKKRFCAISQMAIIGTMNILEFFLVPDLLLFGRMNILFAGIFIALIYINEFVVASRNISAQMQSDHA
jgi:hypothetical protein